MNKKPKLKTNKFVFPKTSTVLVLLSIITVFSYLPLHKNDFIRQYDDYEYIINNSHVATGLNLDNIIWAFSSFYSANWHPLTWISHITDCQLFGLNPGGHHLVNLIFHLLNTLLLFYLLKLSTRTLWRSACVALLFAIHPMHVESVAWIAERKDVLCTFFAFSSIILYYHYVNKKYRYLYFLSLFLFVCGLMAKPMLVTIPLLLILLDYWPFGRYGIKNKTANSQDSIKTIFLEKVPFIFFSAISCVITILAQKQANAIASIDQINILNRIVISFTAYLQYITKLFFPVNLSIVYPYHGFPDFYLIILSIIVLSAITYIALNKSKQYPWLISGWLWFIITLIPVIGIVKVGEQIIADRYTYIPYIGLFIIIFWTTEIFIRKYNRYKTCIIVIILISAIILVYKTQKEVRHWKNDITIFSHSIKNTHDNYISHNNLGLAYSSAGLLDKAIFHYKESIKIKSNIYALNNLGNVMLTTRNIEQAIKYFNNVLKIRHSDTETFYKLGLAYYYKGNFQISEKYYKKVIEQKPNYWEAYNNLGLLYARKGEPEKSIQTLTKAIHLAPGKTNPHFNRGNVYYSLNLLDSAKIDYLKILEIDRYNAEAYYLLYRLENEKGNFNKAKNYLLQAESMDINISKKACVLDSLILKFKDAYHE